MQRLYSSVTTFCLILWAGIFLISCGSGGDPVTPTDVPGSGTHDTSASGELTYPGQTESGFLPPAYPHTGDEPDYAPGGV